MGEKIEPINVKVNFRKNARLLKEAWENEEFVEYARIISELRESCEPNLLADILGYTKDIMRK